MKKIILIVFAGMAAVLIGWTAVSGENTVNKNSEKNSGMITGIINPNISLEDGLVDALEELAVVERPIVRGMRVSGEDQSFSQLSTEDQLRRDILIQLIGLYGQLIELKNTVVAQDANFVSAELSYDKYGNVTVEVIDSNGVRDDFVVISRNEQIIIDRIVSEYQMDVSDVISETSFSYRSIDDRIQIGGDTRIEAKVRGGKTVITLLNDGIYHTAWIDTTNVYEATEEFAKIIRVRTNDLWRLY